MRAMIVAAVALTGVLISLGAAWGIVLGAGSVLALYALSRREPLHGARAALPMVAVVSAIAAFVSLRPATLGPREIAMLSGAFRRRRTPASNGERWGVTPAVATIGRRR